MKSALRTHAPLAAVARVAFVLGALAPAMVALSPSVVHAQDDATVVEARARFREGVALYDEGKYEAARAKFKQAYALKQHPDVLLNLGWSSLKSGHPQEAEESFSNYLRDAKDAPPAKRAEAEKGLAQARANGGGAGAGAGTSPSTSPTSSGAPAAGNTAGTAPSSGNVSPNATPTSTGGTPQPATGAAAGAGTTPGTDTPAPAEGAGAPVKEPIRIDALLGYTSDNVNVGIGVRGGKVVTQHLYVGGSFVYNFGTSFTVGSVGGTETVSTSAFYIGPEVGWDFTGLAPNFTLRPYGGLGFASFNVSTSFVNQNNGANASSSASRLLFWPGVTAIYDIPNTNFMVGGDARLVFVPSSSVGWNGGPAFGIFATGGIRL
jgi:Tetratricopeptide repeat